VDLSGLPDGTHGGWNFREMFLAETCAYGTFLDFWLRLDPALKGIHRGRLARWAGCRDVAKELKHVALARLEGPHVRADHLLWRDMGTRIKTSGGGRRPWVDDFVDALCNQQTGAGPQTLDEQLAVCTAWVARVYEDIGVTRHPLTAPEVRVELATTGPKDWSNPAVTDADVVVLRYRPETYTFCWYLSIPLFFLHEIFVHWYGDGPVPESFAHGWATSAISDWLSQRMWKSGQPSLDEHPLCRKDAAVGWMLALAGAEWPPCCRLCHGTVDIPRLDPDSDVVEMMNAHRLLRNYAEGDALLMMRLTADLCQLPIRDGHGREVHQELLDAVRPFLGGGFRALMKPMEAWLAEVKACTLPFAPGVIAWSLIDALRSRA
jgi:hypothetical protein